MTCLSIATLAVACADDADEPTGSGGSGGAPATTSAAIGSATASTTTTTTGAGGGAPDGWAIAFGEGPAASAGRVVVDSANDIVVSGGFSGTIELGRSSLTSLSDGTDAFIAKLDPDGAAVWALQLGTTSGYTHVDIAIGPDDDIVAAGHFNGALTLGGMELDAGTFSDVFAARWSRDGELTWVEHFACDEDAFVSGVAVDDAGNVVFGGEFGGTCDFGDFDLTAAIRDGYLVALGENGVPTWSRAIGGAATGDSVSGVAIEDDGNVIASGAFRDATDFGDGAAVTPDGIYDLYVARYDAAGQHLSHTAIAWEGTGYLDGSLLDSRGSGEAVVAGQYLGVTLGDRELDGEPTYNQIFVAGFDAAGGLTMSAGFGELGSEDHVRGVALGERTLALVGIGRSIDFGGGALGSGSDAFVAVLDDAGGHVMSDRVADGLLTFVEDVAFDSNGDLVMVGTFAGTSDFGFGDLDGNDEGSAFVVKRPVR